MLWNWGKRIVTLKSADDGSRGWEDGLSESGEKGESLGVEAGGLNLLDGSVFENGKGLGSVNGEEVGEKTTDMRGSHRSTGDGVGGFVSSVPGGEDVESWGENIDTFTVVGEVGSLVAKGRCTDSDGLVSGSGGVVAGVLVVANVSQQSDRIQGHSLSSGNSKVETSFDGSVDGIIERLCFSSTKRHVGDGTLVLCLSSSSEFLSGGLGFGSSVFSGPAGIRLELYTHKKGTHTTPATTSLIDPLPLLPRTLTATSLAFLATPYFLEAMVPAQ